MITFEIKPPRNINQIIRILSLFPAKMERAGADAVRRTLKGGRQDAARKIAQRYTIKTRIVTDKIRTYSKGLQGSMESKGSRINLREFLLKPKKRTKGRPQPPAGIFVQNVRGDGGNLFHAWNKFSGGIFQRKKGVARLPFHGFAGPAAPQMLGSKPVSSYIVAKMEERLGVNLDHAAQAVLGGFL